MTRHALAVDNNGGTLKKITSGLEQSGDAPTYPELAEPLGGSEYLTFWRPPFKLIGVSQEEDE